MSRSPSHTSFGVTPLALFFDLIDGFERRREVVHGDDAAAAGVVERLGRDLPRPVAAEDRVFAVLGAQLLQGLLDREIELTLRVISVGLRERVRRFGIFDAHERLDRRFREPRERDQERPRLWGRFIG